MSIESKLELPGFKHVFPLTVKWGDMDAMGHVNNTRYFYYGESARFEFLLKLFPQAAAMDTSDLEYGFALAYADTKFKVSLTYPDQVLVGTSVIKIEETEFHLKHSIYSSKMSCEAAVSTARIVSFDFKHSKRRALDAKAVDMLEQYRG